ncbi:putative methyltransferase-domain-containing protein [Lipomyces oligophaga]|uniref:putative methyltransferase-domain-containing protein n=1 Tax=Lipomyces oligophaga TaxID=45792 RepID=UPI0034CDD4AC
MSTTTLTEDTDNFTSAEESLLQEFTTEFVPERHDVIEFAGIDYSISEAGILRVEFCGVAVEIRHDGGATGCGGKVWPAGDLLSRYLISIRDGEVAEGDDTARRLIWQVSKQRKIKIVELGSGTGLVGLALGNAYKKYNPVESENGLDVIVTDQENMLNLMQDNIDLNHLEGIVRAGVLDWGTDLGGDYEVRPDIVLAADCVYFEPAFPLLEKTLVDLATTDTLVLMAYKKRRKADSRFFKAIRKSFQMQEIKGYSGYEEFSRDSTFLYRLIKK